MRFISFFIFLFFIGCSNNIRINDRNALQSEVLKLSLKPRQGEALLYKIRSENEMHFDGQNGRTSSNIINESDVSYQFLRDSLGFFNTLIDYQKVVTKTKKDGQQTEVSSLVGLSSFNPVEKMLALLTETKFNILIDSSGRIIKMEGYDSLEIKLMTLFIDSDESVRKMVKNQWQNFIGNSIVEKNINYLFNLFPDSLIRVGDKWKSDIRNSVGEVDLLSKSFFELSEVDDEYAIIKSKAELSGDTSLINIQGVWAKAILSGTQVGMFKVDRNSGLLSEADSEADVSGTITVVGKEIPISIKTKLSILLKK